MVLALALAYQRPVAAEPNLADAAAFLGAIVLPDGLTVEGTPLGGLSGLAYDSSTNSFLALSDDRETRLPTRAYRMVVAADGGYLAGLQIEGAVRFQRGDGSVQPAFAPDGEAIAFAHGTQTLIWAIEGDGTPATPSRIFESRLDGGFLRELPVPAHILSDMQGRTGAARNKQIEALALTPDEAAIWIGVEGPLRQDAQQSTERATFVRLSKLDRDGRPQRQIAYPLDPLPVADADRGLVELIGLPGDRLLALERSYARSRRTNFVRLYVVETVAASDVAAMAALPEPAAAGDLKPAAKRLLIDLNAQRLQMDNYEAMALGPTLPDGHRLLLIASDNNFNPSSQRTIVAAFALDPAVLR